ncbi:MAG: type II toxin-antitoxin system RelB/DinJ family antitoxin [Opitutaceae bacterium]|jgi:DNA-damage-inducible protein J|nr:type II toxin-antitoxin system RelB/DinJ family antitoxin [Opitutaceae bacterium]
MIAKETYVRARVDEQLKNDAESILAQLGLTTAESIRLFLSQVRLRKGIPFDLRLEPDNSDILMPAQQRQAVLDTFYDD